MTRSRHRHRLLSCFAIVSLFLSACAAPKAVPKAEPAKSYVVLLPKDGKVSGEVTVTNAHGTQTLDRSWEKAEIAGAGASPSAPHVIDEKKARAEFGKVLSAMPAPALHFTVYFPLNSTELTADSRRLVREIAKKLKEREPVELTLVGHTDSRGGEGYNQKLGQARAEAVLEALKALGAAPVRVETVSRGKSEPAVKTPDHRYEPRNRRVEITIR